MKKMWSKKEVVTLIRAVVNEMLQAATIYLGDGDVLIEEASIKKLLDNEHSYGSTGQVLSNDNGNTKWVTPE